MSKKKEQGIKAPKGKAVDARGGLKSENEAVFENGTKLEGKLMSESVTMLESKSEFESVTKSES